MIDTKIDLRAEVLDSLNLKPVDRMKLIKIPKVLDYILDLQEEIERLQSRKIKGISYYAKSSKQYPISQIDPKSKEIQVVYKNCKEAAEGLGVSTEAIRRAVDKPKYRCKGYALKRLEDYKICNQCGFEGKASEHFHIANRGKHGITYKSKCKQCIKENNK